MTLREEADAACQRLIDEIVQPAHRDAWFTSEHALILHLMGMAFLDGRSSGIKACAHLISEEAAANVSTPNQ